MMLWFWGQAHASFEKDLYQTAVDFLSNPKMFFLDLQYDTENTLPLMGEENSEIQTNLFLQFLGIASLNLKYRAYQGEDKIPSITAGVGGWYFWALNLLPKIDALKEAKDLRCQGGPCERPLAN